MPCWKLPSWHTLCCVYSDSYCGSQSRLNDSQYMQDVVMLLKGAHLTLNFSIEATSLLHHYAARPVPNVNVCKPAAAVYVQHCATQTALNRCLHMACLPTKHGNRESQRWRVTWPSASCLTHKHQAASCGLQTCPCCTHTSTPLSPASSISLHRSADVPMGRSAYLLQEQDQECGATVFSQPDRPLESINESRLQVV